MFNKNDTVCFLGNSITTHMTEMLYSGIIGEDGVHPTEKGHHVMHRFC